MEPQNIISMRKTDIMWPDLRFTFKSGLLAWNQTQYVISWNADINADSMVSLDDIYSKVIVSIALTSSSLKIFKMKDFGYCNKAENI